MTGERWGGGPAVALCLLLALAGCGSVREVPVVLTPPNALRTCPERPERPVPPVTSAAIARDVIALEEAHAVCRARLTAVWAWIDRTSR